MPYELPGEFEAKALKGCLKSIERQSPSKRARNCLAFALLGGILLAGANYGFTRDWISLSLMQFISAVGGMCLGCAAIVNRASKQSEIVQKYLDTDAIRSRLRDIER